MKFLVTGSAGYIGGTFCFEALKSGHEVFGIDNYVNSQPKVTKELSYRFNEKFTFSENSIDDIVFLSELVDEFKPDCLFHFAALKSVSESEKNPSIYWKNNLQSTFNLVEAMRNSSSRKIVYSSSATVYGNGKNQPLKETDKLSATSVYGKTKVAIESYLNDCANSDLIDCVSLRYFNPVASHEEKIIIEDINNCPENLMPRIIRAALNIDQNIKIFGTDYPTRDGTGERDFIHISDLVRGHFEAFNFIQNEKGYHPFNLGTGSSVSVLELINKFMEVNGVNIEYQLIGRRKGDIAISIADAGKANRKLGWYALKDLSEMCRDSWFAFKENYAIRK